MPSCRHTLPYSHNVFHSPQLLPSFDTASRLLTRLNFLTVMNISWYHIKAALTERRHCKHKKERNTATERQTEKKNPKSNDKPREDDAKRTKCSANMMTSFRSTYNLACSAGAFQSQQDSAKKHNETFRLLFNHRELLEPGT